MPSTPAMNALIRSDRAPACRPHAATGRRGAATRRRQSATQAPRKPAPPTAARPAKPVWSPAGLMHLTKGVLMIRRRALALAASGLMLPQIAHARSWLSRPVRLAVAEPADPSTWLLADIVARALSESLNHPVLLDSGPGAPDAG